MQTEWKCNTNWTEVQHKLSVIQWACNENRLGTWPLPGKAPQELQRIQCYCQVLLFGTGAKTEFLLISLNFLRVIMMKFLCGADKGMLINCVVGVVLYLGWGILYPGLWGLGQCAAWFPTILPVWRLSFTSMEKSFKEKHWGLGTAKKGLKQVADIQSSALL